MGILQGFTTAEGSVEGGSMYVFDLYRWAISWASRLFACALAVGPRRRWNAKTTRADTCNSGPLPHGIPRRRTGYGAR